MGRSITTKLVIVSSLTGNTDTFVNYLDQKVIKNGGNIRVARPDDIIELQNYETIAFGSYTWKDGKIPKDIKDYILSNAHRLYGKRVIVFGSGNSIYPKYCMAVDSISKICRYYGCTVFGEIKFEQRFNLEKLDPSEIKNIDNILEEWSN